MCVYVYMPPRGKKQRSLYSVLCRCVCIIVVNIQDFSLEGKDIFGVYIVIANTLFSGGVPYSELLSVHVYTVLHTESWWDDHTGSKHALDWEWHGLKNELHVPVQQL